MSKVKNSLSENKDCDRGQNEGYAIWLEMKYARGLEQKMENMQGLRKGNIIAKCKSDMQNES